jgi:GT2 family glycosyltransferase
MNLPVVIPAADFPEMLWRLELCLAGLLDQTQPASEIVVVDSIGLSDAVRQTVQPFKALLPVQAVSLPPSTDPFRAGPARNHGVSLLQRDWERVVFLDADCVAVPDVLASHAQFAARPVVVAGARAHVNPLQLLDRTVAAVRKAATTPDKRLQHPENWKTHHCSYGCHLSVPRSHFTQVGGFWDRVIYGEDLELGLRLIRAGAMIQFSAQPAVRHIDHPIWRPTCPEQLPDWAIRMPESTELPGYLRVPRRTSA